MQEMDVFNFDQNKGLIPLKLGNARIITNYNRLIHIINLSSYEHNLQVIKTNIVNIGTFTRDRPDLEIIYKTKLDILQMKVKNLEETLDYLRPRMRNKRGLINGLGSVVKSITGNMDHDDFVELGRAITEINKNEDILASRYNDQININTKMIDRFNEIQKYVNDQTRKIEFEIRTFENNTQNLIIMLKLDQNFHKTIYNIELLENHLKDIAEALTMAKLKIISRHILNHQEMDYIHDHLNKFNIKLKSEESIYSLLWLQAYYNQSQLILSIQMPNFHSEHLHHYKIKAIPINSTLIILTPNTHLILNEHIYQFITKPCNQVEDILFCEKQSIQNSSTSCIAQIINNKPAVCNFTKQPLQEEIEQLAPNYLFISTQQEIPISSTCNQKQKSITGIKLINFRNCTIQIQDDKYSNEVAEFQDSIIMLLPYNDIITNKIHEPITLSNLSNWTHTNNNRIHMIHTTTIQHEQQRNIFLGTCSILIILVVIYFSVKKFFPTKRTKQQSNVQLEAPMESATPAAQKRPFCTPLRGEELRRPTTSQQKQTSSP